MALPKTEVDAWADGQAEGVIAKTDRQTFTTWFMASAGGWDVPPEKLTEELLAAAVKDGRDVQTTRSRNGRGAAATFEVDRDGEHFLARVSVLVTNNVALALTTLSVSDRTDVEAANENHFFNSLHALD
jgi:hypothetical protein